MKSATEHVTMPGPVKLVLPSIGGKVGGSPSAKTHEAGQLVTVKHSQGSGIVTLLDVASMVGRMSNELHPNVQLSEMSKPEHGLIV